MLINDRQALRSLYPGATERSLRKQLDRLDEHCRRFVGLSPFVVLASVGEDGLPDASPRGGPPGFVRVQDEHTLLLPDSPGNNRLDTLGNIVANRRIGMLFLVPGVDETLRVNGEARILSEPQLLASFADEKRTPRVVLEIRVREAYLHCAKALMRSRLWSEEARVERDALPTMNQMIHDQIGSAEPPESQEAMLARYANDL
ncbi:MAG: pyridoxamine 5'-phosphate oxidase family protein [Quisquiliibacterium sp.]